MILRIVLERPSELHTGEFKEIYRNTLDCDDSVQFDYQALLKGLKMLYPYNNLIINLTLL